MVEHKADWFNSPNLGELFAMACEPSGEEVEKLLVYPKLSKPNQFREYKKHPSFALPAYSKRRVLSVAAIKERRERISRGEIDFNTSSLKKLKHQLNEELPDSKKEEVPDPLKESLKEAIQTIFKEHKDSRKKLLQKNFQGYEWTHTILRWLGEKEMEHLRSTLKAWYEKNIASK